MDTSKLYYEDYDDQNGDEFDYVQVEGHTPVPMTDLDAQVAEFRRLYGREVGIVVYRDDNARICV